jgi:hypothetical protein
MAQLRALPAEKIIDELAVLDSFFAAANLHERDHLTDSFAEAANDACPHIVTILHHDGFDAAFNKAVKIIVRTSMKQPKERAYASLVTKTNANDAPDARTKYCFSNPESALAFARAVESDFAVKTARHTIILSQNEKPVFRPD